jgi:hypothetical protein
MDRIQGRRGEPSGVCPIARCSQTKASRLSTRTPASSASRPHRPASAAASRVPGLQGRWGGGIEAKGVTQATTCRLLSLAIKGLGPSHRGAWRNRHGSCRQAVSSGRLALVSGLCQLSTTTGCGRGALRWPGASQSVTLEFLVGSGQQSSGHQFSGTCRMATAPIRAG